MTPDAGIAASRIDALFADELARFEVSHPKSGALWRQGQQHWLYGAPSHWMRRWIGSWPVSLDCEPRAYSARVTDVDGHTYSDFCLGDTGGMCGHGHPAITEALSRQASSSASSMLPTPDAAWVGQELVRRFGMAYWNLTTSASDANRACIRLARMVTGRCRVLVFSGCYHGSVEEAHIELVDGQVRLRNGIHANGFPHDQLARVVEFNDLAALEQALAQEDIACVLTEPAMTNYGMILPQPGFHAALRRLTRAHGAALILDETHTLSSGPGGYARLHGLEADMLVLGKAIAGGVPAGAFGVSAPMADRVRRVLPPVGSTVRQSAHAGFGGTLAGNALSVAAIRAVLSHVLTEQGHAHMLALTDRLAAELRQIIARRHVPWRVEQVGARAELLFGRQSAHNAGDIRRGRHAPLEALLHLHLLNRQILITPFHNMMLCCPATTVEDVNRLTHAVDGLLEVLCR